MNKRDREPAWDTFQKWNHEIQKNRPPKPFPMGRVGGYPTRICWVVMKSHRDMDKGVTYVGKPSRKAVERFWKEAENPRVRYIYAYEFDRGGLVTSCTCEGPLHRGLNRDQLYYTQVNFKLQYYYHPWKQDSMLSPHFLDFSRKRLKIGDKVHVHYGKTAKQVLTRPEVAQFKKWVEATWPKPGSIIPKKPDTVTSHTNSITFNAGEAVWDGNTGVFRQR